MIKVELTKDTEQFPAGVVLSVDENSAAALIERGDAKLVDDQAPAPAVQPGGARARELNQQAAAAPAPAVQPGGARARELNQQAAAAAAATDDDDDTKAGEDGEDDD